MAQLSDILQFWGKARPSESANGPPLHPLVFHSLDVAAVGSTLWEKNIKLQRHFCQVLQLPPELARTLLLTLVALHDIGKFAKSFQAKVPALFPNYFAENVHGIGTSYNHASGGWGMLEETRSVHNFPIQWEPLLNAAVGHHGTPPDEQNFDNARARRRQFGKKGIEAAKYFTSLVMDFFACNATTYEPDISKLADASFLLAGFTTLCDWLGSNENWFPYRCASQFPSLESYWEVATGQAESAVTESGVLPTAPSEIEDYEQLIGDGRSLTPMQEWARDVPISQDSSVFMIEDETGSGKTEAALILAHRLMREHLAEGFYFALPTMATANAMFDRVGRLHRMLFAEGQCPSVALCHGARELHPGFRSAGSRIHNPESHSIYQTDPPHDEDTAIVECAEWIADERRRAFLANIGIGTVDQAIMGVLPSRFQALRLYGMARRVLILDEVHAYDSYMSREIESLIQFQTNLGGTTIVLSATLPQSIRNRLADIELLDDATTACDLKSAAPYPAVTTSPMNEPATTKAIAARSQDDHVVAVKHINDVENALAAIAQAAEKHAAVLYIRNTVDDAVEAYTELSERGLQVDLFHARCALVDRLAKEQHIVNTFGKSSTAEQRAGRVLVATQVVEQSLDLDFDAMFSDLAPIDLMVQRAGRLWRHSHRERPNIDPTLHVISPQPVADPTESWYSSLLPRAAYVYQNHALLWLSAKTLLEEGEVRKPSRMRHLVDSVYEGDPYIEVPDGLHSSLVKAQGNDGAARGVATMNLLNRLDGYARGGGAWSRDQHTPTRLVDDPQLTIRLGVSNGGQIGPYAGNSVSGEDWYQWRLSEVSISMRKIAGELIPDRLAPAVKQAKSQWTRHDEAKVLIPLEHNGGEWTGQSASSKESSRPVDIRYDPHIGLQIC